MLKDFASQQNLPVTNNKNAGNAEYFSNPALFAVQQPRLLHLPSIKKGIITQVQEFRQLHMDGRKNKLLRIKNYGPLTFMSLLQKAEASDMTSQQRIKK